MTDNQKPKQEIKIIVCKTTDFTKMNKVTVPQPDCKTGCAPMCSVCLMRKKPIGRSAPMEMANSLCDSDCVGYRQDPTPCDLWPGEAKITPSNPPCRTCGRPVSMCTCEEPQYGE